MANPTRNGKIVFDQLQKLGPKTGRSAIGIAQEAGISISSVHAAFRNIRTVLGPIHGEPLVWFRKNGTCYYRLTDSAQEVKDYNAVQLAGIVTRLRTQADVAEAGYKKTGDPELYASASSLRMQASNVETVQKQLLGAP